MEKDVFGAISAIVLGVLIMSVNVFSMFLLLSLMAKQYRNADRAGIIINLVLSISDMMTGILLMVLGISNSQSKWRLPCHIQAGLVIFPSVTSLILTLVISYRRYIIIIRPLNLKRIQSIHTTIIGVVASVLIGVASFLAVCLMPKYSNPNLMNYPETSCWNEISNKFQITLLSVIYIPVVFTTSICHIRILNISSNANKKVQFPVRQPETKKILRCVLYDKLKCAIAPSLNYSDLQSSADSRSNLNLPSPEDKLAGRLFLDVYFGLNSYSFDRSPSPHPASLPSPVGSASGRDGLFNQLESSRSSSRIDQNLELQKKSMRHSEVLK
jgi:hypothetical protein